MKKNYTKQAIENVKNDEMTYELKKVGSKLAEFIIIAGIYIELLFKNIGKGIKKLFNILKDKLYMLKLKLAFNSFIIKRERKSKKYMKQIEAIQKKKDKYFSKHYRTIDKKLVLIDKQKEDNIKHNDSVERINDMLELIRIIWSKPENDQLRLGQLILNVVKEDQLYYLEDEDLYRMLKKQYIRTTRELKL